MEMKETAFGLIRDALSFFCDFVLGKGQDVVRRTMVDLQAIKYQFMEKKKEIKVGERRNVYVVTSGEYSDYRIRRVFSDRKKAKEFIDTVGDNYRIETYALDEPTERETKVWRVRLDTKRKAIRETSVMSDDSYKDLFRLERDAYSGEEVMEIYVESDSKERAEKIASERYGAVFANEKTMYPLLRMDVLKMYGERRRAMFDFYTGELFVPDGYSLAIDLPSFVKMRKED